MQGLIKGIVTHRFIIMKYAKEEFHGVRGHLFNIINDLVDAQMKIRNVAAYMTKRIRKFNKYASRTAWKYNLKYSKGVAKICSRREESVMDKSVDITKETKAIAETMTTILTKFKTGAQADLDAWDCNAMYPKPKPLDLGKPGWLGAITKVAT
jgi:hypothetical protein